MIARARGMTNDAVPAGSVTIWVRVDDIGEAHRRLVSLGSTERFPPTEKPWGDVLASVLDPEGNILGISKRR